jgi:hypothetical protein
MSMGVRIMDSRRDLGANGDGGHFSANSIVLQQ